MPKIWPSTMSNSPQSQNFKLIHIDVARNATDDFNLFHDKNKWQQILGNPFGGPIVLGFQLECLIENKILKHRRQHSEELIIREHNLQYSNYQISFANAVKPDSEVIVDIRDSQFRDGEHCELSNRICVKSEGHLDLIGYKKETQEALYLADEESPPLKNLSDRTDRTYIPGTDFFLKRKFMTTSNAKNFLCGSLVEQSDYFDELEEKINFPETYSCGLISCALLERAMHEKHDFIRNPMVYTSHKISVNRNHLPKVKSNAILHLLIRKTEEPKNTDNNEKELQNYHCFGIIGNETILFRALITLAPLNTVLSCGRRKRKHP